MSSSSSHEPDPPQDDLANTKASPPAKASRPKVTQPKTKRASKPGSTKTKAKRLNQLLASAGYGSRRHVEELVREGRVTIDGDVVTTLGVNVDPKLQTIRVDGVVWRQQKLVYYAVHKPTGVVTTNSDPHGRPRVIDLVPPSERVFPVGRLDRSSEGLILLTNDGDLAQKLAHPKFAIQKVYRVTVAGKVDNEALRKMRQGIYIAEGLVRVDGARVLKAKPRATEMEIRLREGKNREIRRILARLGHKVQTLRRIAIGPLRLGDMPAAAYRKLTHEEIRRLHDAAERAEKELRRPKQDDSETETDRKAPRAAKRSRGSKASVPKSRGGVSATNRSRVSTSRRTSETGGAGRKKTSKKAVKRSRSTPATASRRPATTTVKRRTTNKKSTPSTGIVIGADEPVQREKPKRDRGAAKKSRGPKKRAASPRSRRPKR